MKLDPAESGFAQLAYRLGPLFRQFDLVELLPSEQLRQFPAAFAQRPHPRLAALLAEQSAGLRKMVSRLVAKTRSTFRTAIEWRQPASQSNRPERKVRERQLPRTAPLNLPGHQEQQPEHRLRHFLLRQNALSDFANHRQPGAQAIVALRLVERLQQFTLLDAYQV